MQDEEFIQSFVEESKAHIETVENELMNLNIECPDMESINNIFRAVHTIKGTSGFFDFKNIVSLSHALENLFGEIRAGHIGMTNEMVDILLTSNDCLKVMIDDVSDSENVEISNFVKKLSAFLEGDSPAELEKAPNSETGNTDLNDGCFNLDDYRATATKKALIQSEIRRGCSFYLLKRKLYADLIANDLNLAVLLQEIGSMGSVIDLNVNLENVMAQPEEAAVEVDIEILFMTVLEKDFLPSMLLEPEENIVELLIKLDSDAVPELAEKEKSEEKTAGFSDIVSGESTATAETLDREKHRGVAIAAEDSVRVNVTLLNSLLNLSSEMVLARNQLFRKMEKSKKEIPGLDVIFQNINHITTNLQETIMQTRMQPVSNVFSKFPRIARDLSKKLEKDITLELEGTEVELDKSIIEALGDPLTHLVRNAIDHGMEHPGERILLDKPRMGNIKLKAYHESGYVNIDVIDDGKGIDTDVIRRKAFDKGFISRVEVDTLCDQESLQLLFRPGFSTAEVVTDLSGRGVGMDVVKTNIEKLGGKIEIFTSLGNGTTFRLLLPLTLAIIPSLIVEAERQKFALPQINVQEIVRIKRNDIGRRIEFINNSEVLRLRGRLLPIVHLADVLGLQKTYIDPMTGERVPDKRKKFINAGPSLQPLTSEPSDETVLAAAGEASLALENRFHERRGFKMENITRVLVIKIGARRLGLSVDTIHGIEEILVKTLPTHIKECNNYSGVTILGDGKVAMILDPSGIIENANLRYMDDTFETKSKLQISESEKMRERQSLLLFKCSGPETMALDMAMVSRVEEISAKDIEQIGDKEYIKFRGEPLRIVRPENYISIQNQTAKTNGAGKYYVIIPKLVKHPMGILIEKMHDTLQASLQLTENDSIVSKGIIGSTILNDTIVLLLNVYELFEMACPEHYKIENAVKQREPIKVLLVEDTPFFQKLEKDYLENAGYHVTVADNGKVALQILQTEKFDIIVSDINMPEMNGLEFVKRIRADSALCKLPVIAVTSLTGEQQQKEGLSAGFDAYEFKLDRSKLIEIMEQTLKERGMLS